MKILKGILSESREYYLETKKKIEKKLKELPRGSVKERKIYGKKYFYLQKRKGRRVVHEYLGKSKPTDLLEQIKQRKVLKQELKKVNESLKILRRSTGKKR
ncbi:MAG: hypothetical protein ISS45_09700 [Candidatus Omnitrophica bacterium]|nr:hypothetical protein [Candidatus Omnitrophota bacterium]